jgi:hypothetical protein
LIPKVITAMPNLIWRRPTRGFIYVSHADTGSMSRAAPGRHVQIADRAPPWLVVDHELATVIVARWPGRLWAVEVLDSISAEEQIAAQSRLPSDVWYTRAAAVKVLHAVPIAALFGSHGARVCAVIEAASELTSEQAARFAQACHPGASAAQLRAWRNWLSRQQLRTCGYGDLDGMQAMPVQERRSVSPVGYGLSVIHSEVGKRAEAIAGSSVWTVDDTDSEGAWLAEPWSKAGAALCDAALAFGAPDLLGEEDINILATAWREIIGADPTLPKS